MNTNKTVQPLSLGALGLLLATSLIALIWLIVLPAISSWHPVRARWEALQDRGIDPSALYYTDLEVMKPILRRLEYPEQHREGRT
jgi:hypothetical protein